MRRSGQELFRPRRRSPFSGVSLWVLAIAIVILSAGATTGVVLSGRTGDQGTTIYGQTLFVHEVTATGGDETISSPSEDLTSFIVASEVSEQGESQIRLALGNESKAGLVGELTFAAPGQLALSVQNRNDVSCLVQEGPFSWTFALAPDVTNNMSDLVVSIGIADEGAPGLYEIGVNLSQLDYSSSCVAQRPSPSDDASAHAPDVEPDAYSIEEEGVLEAGAPGVLANDSDRDGGSLSALLAGSPPNGAVILNPDGSFIYTPNPNFQGVDTFTYVASDGSNNSNIVTVEIIVENEPDAPATEPDAYSTEEDVALNVTDAGVLANDLSLDGTPLLAKLIASPEHGTIVFNRDGSFDYMPDPNFNGVDTFSYSASGGSLASEVTEVSITVRPVEDRPTANDDAYEIGVNQTLEVTVPGILANDADVEGNDLTVMLVGGANDGVLTLNATGAFTYTPNANFRGADTFTYVAHDGAVQSSNATVTITVTGP